MAITSKNGVALSGITNINGVTSISAINGVSATIGGGSGPALVSNTGAGNDSTSVTTSSIDTTGANLLVVHIAFYDPTAGTVTVSDSKGNTWTPLTQHTASALYASRLYYSYGGTVGSGHTFTVSTTTGYPSVQVAAFSNISSSPLDLENGNTIGSTWTDLTTGSITPTQNNTVAFAGLSFDDNTGGVISIDSSYSITDTVPYSSGNTIGGSMAYKILSSTAANNPQWTTSSSASYGAASIANFKY